MFIKNIIISGFRSYRDQAFPDELSQGNNVVVGKNGSGKSNFFAAIQFVLSEKYATLRANDRKELFHVGAGRPALSVFVEIVFDNTDGRLVIPGRPEEAEVRLRRTIGLKQDEYRVNDRRFSAEEVRQLLESAGFSASNPYYIVEQGKIVQLANMREEDRYELLKEVAGTRVYESRRAESIGLLEDATQRQGKIDESISQLEGRLRELEAESKELKAFQAADRKRKALEYCVFNADLRAAQSELDSLEAQWSSNSRASAEKRDKEQELLKGVRDAEAAMEATKARIAELEVQRKRLEKDRAGLESRKALADLRATEAATMTSREATERKVLEKEDADLQKAIHKAQGDLAEKTKLLDLTKKQVAKSETKLQDDSNRLSVLQAKRGRKGQFSSKSDRDRWIKEEVGRCREVMRTNEKEMAKLTEESAKLRKQRDGLQTAAVRHEAVVKDTEAAFADTEKDRRAALKQRDSLNNDRRKLWQQINEQEAVVRRRAEEAEHAANRLQKSTRLDIRQGHQSLAEVLRELNDPALTKAVHGQVIELMEVEPDCIPAVEITAGNTLFHVVVDTFDVGARILDQMNRRKKPGRLSFFPLDTCNSRPADLPTTAEFSPLLSHVKFNAKFKSVFAELFGRTLLVKTLEAGAAAVAQFDTDAITYDGDQFNRKGGITGGFTDRRNMKLLAYAECKKTARDVEADRKTLESLCQEVTVVEQRITEAMQKLELLSSQDNKARAAVEDGAIGVHSVEEQQDRLLRQEQQVLKTLESLQRSNAALGATIKSLEMELSTDLLQTLSADDEATLERLQSDVGKERAENSTAQSKLLALSTDVELLHDTLRHLERRSASIKERIATLSHTAGDEVVQAGEVRALSDDISGLDKQISNIDKSIAQGVQEEAKRQEEVEVARRRVVDNAVVVQASKDNVDRVHNQRALLQQKKEDAQAKIRKLGIIPPEAESFAGESVPKLLAHLKAANEELKKYGHVNKKAVDQYTALLEARNDLNEKRDGLKAEKASIDVLLTDLDKQRGEAIERTYKQVQYQFEEVFKELVNADGASAQLELVKATRSGNANPAEAFSAVRVKVSFGLGAPVSELSQLSGGQKSLVALALIFAIQRSDPAPFYLFDEIDAALDSEYRTAVARLLKKQSAACQFITASFKTEMVEAADRVYGIFFTNKVSRIQPLTQDQGIQLLRQAAAEDAGRKRTRDGAAEVAANA